MFQVTVNYRGKSTALLYQKPVLLASALQDCGVPFSMPCGGRGICGKCKVTARGALSEPGEKEREVLGEELEQGRRLACLAQALGDVQVFAEQAETMVLSDGELPEFSPEPSGSGLGFAVDVGTTTVAVYCYDQKKALLLGKGSFPNPQGIFGADVISRIEKALAGEAEALRACLKERLEECFLKLCQGQGAEPGQVDSVVVTGNTTMMYLLFGESVEPLSHAPFEAPCRYGAELPKSALGMEAFPNAKVYVPPLIGAFVGSDITSAVLSSGITRKPEISLLIDVGTNGEMGLWDGERLFCCSTAAGPAFEGAGISTGMSAAPGAIGKVWLEAEEIRCEVIGGGKALGICGSGLIDGVAALLDAGLIDESGCIDESCEPFSKYVTEIEGEPALLLGESGIALTQKDIRQVQLAKSAICAGIRSLLHESGKTAEDLKELLLAGGFGSFIDCERAGRIGLIPQELVAKARAVGNAAGMGAILELLSLSGRRESRKIVSESNLLELSSSPYFMEQYVECMMF